MKTRKFSMEEIEIDVRIPIIDKNDLDKNQIKKIENQWNFLSGKIIKTISENKEFRIRFLNKYKGSKVEEKTAYQLFGQFVEFLKNNGNIRLLNQLKTKQELKTILGLDEIPKELLTCNIIDIPNHKTPEETIKLYKNHTKKRDLKSIIKKASKSDDYKKGITNSERLLINLRSKFARDIKLIYLYAYTLQHPEINNIDQENITTDEGIEINIKGGIGNFYKALKQLQNPKKIQIKDRVHMVITGKNKLIIKEKKSFSHINTTTLQTLSSEKEYATALELVDFEKFGINIDFEKFGINIEFEKAIGYIKFPDGYQFCIFEYDEQLAKDEINSYELFLLLKKFSKRFETEYNEYLSNTLEYFDDFLRLASTEISSSNLQKNKNDSFISFEEFLEVKSIFLMKLCEYKSGDFTYPYFNSDSSKNYKIVLGDGINSLIKIKYFDFELYQKNENILADDNMFIHELINNNEIQQMGIKAHLIYFNMLIKHGILNPKKIR